MIYIKESIQKDQTVIIRADGILDAETVPVLNNVCTRHLSGEKKVILQLEGLLHISREGMDFLKEIAEKINIMNIPQFTNLEKHDLNDRNG